MAVKSHSCPPWRTKRLSLVGQLGFLDSGNVDIVDVEECQQFSQFSADFVRVPLHQSSSSWRFIASDEDVSESYGVSAAQSWARKCDHTGGMQQQPLGQVFFLCGPGAYDRDPANVSF